MNCSIIVHAASLFNSCPPAPTSDIDEWEKRGSGFIGCICSETTSFLNDDLYLCNVWLVETKSKREREEKEVSMMMVWYGSRATSRLVVGATLAQIMASLFNSLWKIKSLQSTWQLTCLQRLEGLARVLLADHFNISPIPLYYLLELFTSLHNMPGTTRLSVEASWANYLEGESLILAQSSTTKETLFSHRFPSSPAVQPNPMQTTPLTPLLQQTTPMKT